jgi:hypothetical protein
MTYNIQRDTGVTIRTTREVPPHMSAGESKDVDGFIDLVASALEDYQRRLGIVEGARLVLRESYPKNPIENPDAGLNLVLYKVISRRLGNMSPDGDRRPLKPQIRYSVDHPTDPTLKLSVLTLNMDNIVEFNIVSPHAKRANEFALMFEKFMLAYTWYFKEMGVSQVYFYERREDSIEEIGGSELHNRPISYFVRTQIISQELAKKIDEVLIKYDVGSQTRTTVVSEQYGIEDTSIVHGNQN